AMAQRSPGPSSHPPPPPQRGAWGRASAPPDFFSSRGPAFTVVSPGYVFAAAPASWSRPSPALIRPPLPETAPPRIRLPAPVTVTVRVAVSVTFRLKLLGTGDGPPTLLLMPPAPRPMALPVIV